MRTGWSLIGMTKDGMPRLRRRRSVTSLSVAPCCNHSLRRKCVARIEIADAKQILATYLLHCLQRDKSVAGASQPVSVL